MSGFAPSATSLLALLRGINVGGKNKLAMRDLTEIFNAAGCGNVRTFIQSGNVIFTAPSKVRETLPADIASAISERFGYRVPVILRTAGQLREVVSGNPFLSDKPVADQTSKSLHVMFLADLPEPERLAGLDPARSPGDRFIVRGPHIYLKLENGVGTSKLTNAWFDSRLATVSTSRNWMTVNRLLEMMQA
ncbi:MAG: DUF1697 domain-containing protein [Acidobacteriota bacterium]|nr:DUF1697 domain-containing protein [Acidobacteriota bacterium]